jgi:hypothetical protein
VLSRYRLATNQANCARFKGPHARDSNASSTFAPIQLIVAADNADEHALDFYRRLGGVATLSTVFVFSRG